MSTPNQRVAEIADKLDAVLLELAEILDAGDAFSAGASVLDALQRQSAFLYNVRMSVAGQGGQPQCAYAMRSDQPPMNLKWAAKRIREGM